MTSIGSILRREREKKKRQIAEIAAATKIPEKYLRAIEGDDYSLFPGETYLVGFIRNYARELELDPGEIISQYKNSRVSKEEEEEEISYMSREVRHQEPVPRIRKPSREELKKNRPSAQASSVKSRSVQPSSLQPQRPPVRPPRVPGEFIRLMRFIFQNPIPLLISLASVILAAILVYIIINPPKCHPVRPEARMASVKIIELHQPQEVYDLNLNEYYKLKLGRNYYTIMGELQSMLEEIEQLDPTVKLFFHLNDSYLELVQSVPREIDIDLDEEADIALKLNSINQETYNLTISKLHEFLTNTLLFTNALETTNQEPQTPRLTRKDARAEAFTSRGEKKKIVFLAEVIEKSYVKAWVDSRETEGKVYYPRQVIEFVASDVIQLQVGNPSGLQVSINGIKVTLGRGGVVKKTIKWKRDLLDEHVYNLVITDWQ